MLKFVLVVLVVVACIYFALRLLDKRRAAGGDSNPVPRGPVGPDDDPDFIWGLNKRVRRPGTPPGTPPGTAPNAGDPVDPLDLGPADPLEPGEPRDPGDEPPAPDAPAR